MKKNKIISIWGNPNSGKTVFSLKLANELSKQKKNVILILCDAVSPTISTIIPLTDTKNKSLGGFTIINADYTRKYIRKVYYS